MRLAILADIHGNLVAFDAALADARSQNADRIILAGDIVVGCPDSGDCWNRAVSLGVPILRGNHERYVCELTPRQAGDAQYAPIRWAAERLSKDQIAAMTGLPMSLVLPEFPDTLFVHASPGDDRDNIAPHTPASEIAAMFPGITQRWIVRGHNHTCMIRPWGEAAIVTTGSVGLPLDLYTTAQYLLMDRRGDGWDFRHDSVPYDLQAALERFDSTGYLASCGPMARLFRRELATGSHYVVPFIRFYKELQKRERISLHEAVDKFMAY